MAFMLSAILLWLGLFAALDFGVLAAFGLAAMGWAWALLSLTHMVWLEHRKGKPPSWHAWSILLALYLGFGCIILAVMSLRQRDFQIMHFANLAALDLFVMPVFVTVCHRMIPFFASNVVVDYTRWRPYWLLGVFWTASLAAMLGFVPSMFISAAVSKLVIACLICFMLWKWFPRGPAPGLLWVLIAGFAWAPVGFSLAAWSEIFAPEYEKASIHILTIGFAGSLIVAMVTRVTLGHSGRELVMPPLAWLAFLTIQIATVIRSIAVIQGEHLALIRFSALILTAGFMPWALSAILNYLSPRVDGKAG